MSSIRSVLLSPLLIPKFVFSLLKKSKLDNFIGGLIFGAVFSLIVNIFTVQTQETIFKQRVFEALETEIAQNNISARGIAKSSQESIDKDEKPNYFRAVRRYDDRVWNSNEAKKYLFEIDPTLQAKIYAHYQYSIEVNNQMLDRVEDYSKENLVDCWKLDNSQMTEEKQLTCQEKYQDVLSFEISSANVVANNTYDLLKEFHPTKDRLGSWWKKLLLGNKSLKVLELEPI